MAYQSLYRKWRPQTFAAMVGQEHVARTLANAVREERMAHAYLFTGPRGTGKTSAARLFAKALNCPERDGAEPCDRCVSCVAIREGRSLDVLEIDGASNRGIDEIRDLRERVGMAATTGRFRFYIIDEVHQLTEAAFNALLKTLEEPPAHVIFILATTDAHKVPATISSRCQHFSFHRHSAAGTRARLAEVATTEGFTLEPAALEQLVQVADGSLRDALSILDQAVAFCGPTIGIDQLTAMLGLVPQAAVVEFAGHLRERNLAAAVQMPNRLAEDGFDLRQFNQQLITHLRGVLAEQSGSARGAAGAGTPWDLPHLLVTIRAFAGIDFSARVTMIPQLPLELAAVEACTAAASGTAVVDATVTPRGTRAEPVMITGSPRHSDSSPPVARHEPRPTAEPIRTAGRQAPRTDGEAVLRAPTIPEPSPFERSSITSDAVPRDMKRLWEKTVSKLRQMGREGSRVSGLCNSCEFLGIEEGFIVLSARGYSFYMTEMNKATTRSVIEPVARDVFGEGLFIRCEKDTRILSASSDGPIASPARQAVAENTDSTSDVETSTRPADADEPVPRRSVQEPRPVKPSPPRDLVSEAKNNATVRMAMDAFGARIDSVIPAEDDRAAG